MAEKQNSQKEGPRNPLYPQDRSNINPVLTEDQKSELLQLLFDHKSSFARDLSEMKVYPHYQHKIDLIGSRKIYKRNYRFTAEDAKVVQEQIDNMLHHGIIEESTAYEFNSPIFLVNKKME